MPPKSSTAGDEQIEYLLLVLSHCELPKPNFKDVASKTGISSANTAQKKYKSIVEASGKFKLVNNQVVPVDGDDADAE